MSSKNIETINRMPNSILGARLRWHQANGWVFDPVIVGPDIIEYTLTKAHMLDGTPSSTSTTSGSLQESRPRSGTRRAAARPYHMVSGDTDDAPLRCYSCLARRRYDRLSG